MEKERKVKILSLAALIVAVLGLTVAFAALSQTLTINGSASVNAAEWDVHFENVGNEETYGDSSVTLPSVSGTKLSNYSMTITKPGDYASFEFDIVNSGTIDAQISKITIPISITKECYGKEASGDCKSYDANDDGYINGADLSTFLSMFRLEYTSTDEALNKKDIIKVGETKRVRLKIMQDSGTTVLLSNAKVLDGDIILDFVQAD